MGGIGTIRYKVAEAARLAGVSASTLRLWETQGLVVPERSVTGHRQYTDADLARLKRISWFRSERGLNPAAIREALEAESAFTEDENGSAMPTEDNGDMQVGRKLRSLRHAAGKTLEQVAGDIGIAASVLSTLERTSQGVSVAVLHNLAEYFGTTVSSLSGEEQTRARALVRAGEWRNWPRTTPGVTVQLLAEGKNQMDCHRFVLAPGASSEGAYRHEGGGIRLRPLRTCGVRAGFGSVLRSPPGRLPLFREPPPPCLVEQARRRNRVVVDQYAADVLIGNNGTYGVKIIKMFISDSCLST